MTILGEMLELLHTSHRRWTTCSAEVTGRSDPNVQRQANDQRVVRMRLPIAPEPPGMPRGQPVETRGARLWAARPDRVRYERDRVVNGTPAVEVTVVNGPSYWSSDPVHGVHSNAGDPQRFRHHPARSVALLLDPAELLALLRLEAQGPTEVAGRACHQLVGVVHPLVIEPISSLPIHVGADDVVVDVDIERGVVLRLESRVAGEAFDVIELGRVAFDEPIDEERFTPDPPPGSVPLSLVSSPAPIGEVARRAPFVVLSPARPPEGTGAIVAHYREVGSEQRPRVSIRLSPEVRTAGASWFVNVEQAADDGDMPHVDSWEPVEIADGPAFVWEGERGRARRCHVRLERAGTHVWLQADMPRTVLLDVASSLEPVPAA